MIPHRCPKENCCSARNLSCMHLNHNSVRKDVIIVLKRKSIQCNNRINLKLLIHYINYIVWDFSGSLQKCGNCRYVYYCNRLCQRDAWRQHKLECPCLLKVAPRIVPDAARMLSRIILKLNNGGEYVKGYYTDKLFRQFKDLMTR